MASSTTKGRYLLPGEGNQSSPMIHHGIFQTANVFNSISRIYKPKKHDDVIGIVIVRTPDFFIVDINSVEHAVLPLTSFDRGCTPARHAMNRFSVVYARVFRTDPWIQTELSCQTNEQSPKTGRFGLIDQGQILRCSLELCKKLRRSPLINHLKAVANNFRIHTASNGFLWYMTDTLNSMIAVQNVLYKYEVENDMKELMDYYQIVLNKLQEQDHRMMKSKEQINQ